MAIAKFTIEMAAELGQLRRDLNAANQVVAQMGAQVAKHYAPGTAALNQMGAAHTRMANQAALSAMAQQKSTKMMVQQQIQLSNQVQDFAVQVAGGQNPLLAFAQQGSQLYAVFGGVRPALAAVTALITPMTVAMTAGAVAVGGVAYAYYKGNEQSKEFRRSLDLTGNAAAMTAGRFEAAIQSISASSNLGSGKVREMAQALVSTGRFSGAGLDGLTKTAALMVQITGKTAQEVAQEFVSMADAPAAYAAKANRSLHFLTDAELKYIETLEANGQRQKAAYVLQEALAVRHSTAVAENLGYFDKALKGTGEAWNSMWDAAFAVGRDDVLEDKLKEAEARLARVQEQARQGLDVSFFLGGAQQEVDDLRETQRLQKQAADRKAQAAAEQQAATDKRMFDARIKGARESTAAAASELAAKKGLLQIDGEILRLQGEQSRSVSQNPALEAYYKEALAKQELLKIDVQRAAVQRALGRVVGSDKIEEDLAAQQKRLELQARLLELDGQKARVQGELSKALSDTAQKQIEMDRAASEAKEAARGSLGEYFLQLAQTRTELEAQAQAIGQNVLEQNKLAFANSLSARAAQIELEWTEKATQAGLEQTEIEQGLLTIRQEQARALEAYGVIHADEYARMYDAQRGIQDGLREYMDSTAKAGEGAKQAVGTVIRSMEDSLSQFVKTGKLDIKDFVDVVIAEFMRLAVIQPFVQSLVGGFMGGGSTPSAAAAPAAAPGYYGPAALGRAFGSPAVEAFAGGGAFTNRVVTHPKRFAFAGGAALGLMGEAGPEAVMPLQRDSRGRLGVIAAVANGGGGGGRVTVNITTAPGQTAQVQRRQDGNGNSTIDVLLRQVQDGLADNVAAGSGSLYKAIGSRFASRGTS